MALTKSFTSLFAEEMAADGIRSDKGPSGLGKTDGGLLPQILQQN